MYIQIRWRWPRPFAQQLTKIRLMARTKPKKMHLSMMTLLRRESNREKYVFILNFCYIYNGFVTRWWFQTHKNVRANDVDQINRKASDDQFGISCGLLNNEDYITNSATFDSTKMCLHLVTNSNFWKHNYLPKATPSTTETSIELPGTLLISLCTCIRFF